MMRFEIFRAESIALTTLLRGGGDWRWRFCSAQGEVLAQSGGYGSELACREAIEALREGAADAEVHSSVEFHSYKRRPWRK